MPRFILDLDISAEAVKALYRGEINTVRAQDRQGRWIQFSAAVLRRFVSHGGVHGTYAVTVDADHRITDIQRVP